MSRKRKPPPPACTCWQHANGARTEVKGYHYLLEETVDGWWYWRCTCGARGKKQGQSPSVSYHQWEKHAIKHYNEG